PLLDDAHPERARGVAAGQVPSGTRSAATPQRRPGRARPRRVAEPRRERAGVRVGNEQVPAGASDWTVDLERERIGIRTAERLAEGAGVRPVHLEVEEEASEGEDVRLQRAAGARVDAPVLTPRRG